MKTFLKIKSAILCSLLLTSIFGTSLMAVESVGDKISGWVSSFPWVGLIADEVTYGPITIKDLSLGDSGRLVFAKPGEKIKGKLKYKIDVNKLTSWDVHHIILGLKDHEAQSCITHSFGVWDKEGKATFDLVAPMEKGLYEVRFDYQDAVLCNTAKEAWIHDQPSSNATIGVVIVE